MLVGGGDTQHQSCFQLAFTLVQVPALCHTPFHRKLRKHQNHVQCFFPLFNAKSKEVCTGGGGGYSSLNGKMGLHIQDDLRILYNDLQVPQNKSEQPLSK